MSRRRPVGRLLKRIASARRSQPKGQHEIGGLSRCGLADRDHRMPLLPNPLLPIRVGEERIVREDDLGIQAPARPA